MASFKLSWLGSWQVAHSEQGELTLQSRKAIALLAYLAVEADKVHTRETLTGLFWPDLPDSNARNNLRVTLNRVNKIFGQADVPFIISARNSVQFNPQSDYWCDVNELENLIDATKKHIHESRATCTECCDELVIVDKLYKGSFLEGFYLKDCEAFEEWQLNQREYYQQQTLEALADLSNYYKHIRDYQTAELYTKKSLDLEPLSEDAHCQLMHLLYYQGKRNAALEQFQTCQHHLDEELGVEPEDETVTLYHKIKSGTLAIEEGLISVSIATVEASTENIQIPVKKHNLPKNTAPFIGREEELQELEKYLTEFRLLTIMGLGGSGKTRLAQEVARAQLNNFSDGVYLVKLAPLRDPNDIVSAIAEAVGYSFRQGKTAKAQLIEFLQHKLMLLVMDNFEHLLGGTDLVTDILQEAPKVRFLVTSRQKLGLSAEAVYPLEGMTYPKVASNKYNGDESERDEYEALLAHSAVQLFLHCAQHARLGFKPQITELQKITYVCQLVQGIPLAIVLAASWLDTLSPAEIATELEVGLDLLETNLRDIPKRQQSIRAVFNYSWQLLTPEEQTAFAQMSVFRSSFTRDAAREITGASLRMLTALVNKSLIHYQTDVARYDIHELMRQLAYERLETLGQIDEVRNTHSKHYLNLLSSNENNLTGPKQQETLNAIENEFDNVRAAWQWAIAQQDVGNIASAFNSLRLVCSIRNRFQDTIILFEAALSFIQSLPEALLHNKLELDSLLALAPAYRALKNFAAPELEGTLGRAQQLCGKLGDARPFSLTLYGLWSFHLAKAECPITLKLAEQSLSLAKQHEDSVLLLCAHHMKATSLYYVGDFQASQDHCEQMLVLYDAEKHEQMAQFYGFDPGPSYECLNLWLLGYPEQALKSSQKVLTLARKQAHPLSLAMALEYSTHLHIFCQEPEAVQKLAEEQLELATKQKFPFFSASATHKLGWALRVQGKEEGLQKMSEGLTAYKNIVSIISSLFSGLLAEAHIQLGQLLEAEILIDELLVYIDKTNECFWSAEVHRLKGEVLFQQNNAEAEKWFRQAIDIAQKQKAKSLELRAAKSLSCLLKQQDKSTEAQQMLSELYDWFIEGFATTDLKEAERLIGSYKSRFESL